jgi:hypothetical protein
MLIYFFKFGELLESSGKVVKPRPNGTSCDMFLACQPTAILEQNVEFPVHDNAPGAISKRFPYDGQSTYQGLADFTPEPELHCG